MIIQTTYISEIDNEEFETAEECLEHEEMLKTHDGVKLYDENRNLILDSDPSSEFEKAYYIYVTNMNKADKYLRWINDLTNYAIPYEIETGKVYNFDPDINEWSCIDREIDRLEELKSWRNSIVFDERNFKK